MSTGSGTVDWRSDQGQSLGPETMILLIVALAAWGLLAWLGRLNSTSQDITNTAQSAARAASIAPDAVAGHAAAVAAVASSNLPQPCDAMPTVGMTWAPGTDGDWLGGSVTVTLRCTIANVEPFSGAGRTVTATDTQVIDAFRIP